MENILGTFIKVYLLGGLLFLSSLAGFGQELSQTQKDQLLQDVQDKQILALGDATHTDYTASKYRVALIKELVQHKDFTLIGIESNLYELYKAFEEFKNHSDVVELNTAIYRMVRNEHLDELFYFLKDQHAAGKPIVVFGFDANLSAENSYDIFLQGLQSQLKGTTLDCNKASMEDFQAGFKKLTPTNLKALLRTQKDYQRVYDYLDCYLKSEFGFATQSFFNKSVSDIHHKIHARFSGQDYDKVRDSLMFTNIEFIKQSYPNQKMVLFGSTSHFIKDPQRIDSKYMPGAQWKSLGERLKQRFESEYFFIAYSGISGNTRDYFGKKVKLGKLPLDSIEYQVAQRTPSDQAVVYVSKTKDQGLMDQATSCRMLGNTFQNMAISSNVDGLFLIRNNNMD